MQIPHQRLPEDLCGGLNVIGPHKPIGSGTIRRCSFVEAGVALLEEVRHYGGRLQSLTYARDTVQCLSLLPVTCSFTEVFLGCFHFLAIANNVYHFCWLNFMSVNNE